MDKAPSSPDCKHAMGSNQIEEHIKYLHTTLLHVSSLNECPNQSNKESLDYLGLATRQVTAARAADERGGLVYDVTVSAGPASSPGHAPPSCPPKVSLQVKLEAR